MNWFELISEEDVELLMEHVDRFRDWYVAGFSYDPLDMSAEVLYVATPMGLLIILNDVIDERPVHVLTEHQADGQVLVFTALIVV